MVESFFVMMVMVTCTTYKGYGRSRVREEAQSIITFKATRIHGRIFAITQTKGKGLFPTEEAKSVPDFQGDFKTLASWTNIKAKLAGAGPGGSYYPDFKDFTALVIRQHMPIYILNGLSPSPRLEMKFNTQVVD